ncbi:hypothetical protein C4D60_Mb05t04790 [Musa balbisiana]|uniref:Uncharacterized protein n=1 Tax=Musa balbisiana TaxID=52838 RepID=A0A4S8JTS0_MUSBA|nr:hypothetical protein C4D60_Mb05t04790 [Musa balbisiana]
MPNRSRRGRTGMNTILAIIGEIVEGLELFLTPQEHFCIHLNPHIPIKFHWYPIVKLLSLQVPFTVLTP